MFGLGQVMERQCEYLILSLHQTEHNTDLIARPSRSHYHLSRNEVMKGLANRFVHSTGYIYFYAGMAIASLLTVFISLLQDCPGTLFYSLELAINALLIAEVGIRGYAFGKVSLLLIIQMGL